MAGRDEVRVIKGDTFWQRRTQLEKTLIVLFSLLSIISASLVLTVAIMKSREEHVGTNNSLREDCKGKRSADCIKNVCLTPACVIAAARLLGNMDRTANPCEDFYQYSCGGFKKKGVPPEKGELSVLGQIDDHLEQQLYRLLTEGSTPDHEPQYIANVRNMYKQCMDLNKIEKDGTSWLEEQLKSVGGWPVLEGEAWNETGFNWLNTIYKFADLGYLTPYLLEFTVDIDFKNTSRRIISVDRVASSVNREYLVNGLEDTIVKAYYDYMVDAVVMMGGNRDKIEDECRQVVEFEIKLANATLSEEERRDVVKLYNAMTIAEAQERFPVIPWLEYVNKLLPSKVRVDESETIVINELAYVESLGKILEETPKRVLANYLMWRAVRYSINYGPEKFRKRAFQYSSAYSGKQEPEPRWRICITHVNNNLVYAFGALYVRKFFDKESKQVAMEITNNIKDEMYKTLEVVTWMDEGTRQSALKKMKNMVTHIAYPDELLDDNKLAEFYNGLVIDTESAFMEASLRVLKFENEFDMGRLREPVNKTEWHSHGAASVVNAYYSPINNAIEFPAGILQGDLFGGERPRYMNYGTFGFVVAHEITHGFDDRGRLFDTDGNLVDWWDPKTEEKFVEKSKCIVDQYSGYVDSQVNMTLNGATALGENIADNGGIKLAYLAYRRWIKEHNQGQEEDVLPAFNELKISSEQLFWISAANSWCTVYRDEDLINSIKTDTHSPGEFRVKGSISNMEEFSRDFKCPTGATMNPVKKCNVW